MDITYLHVLVADADERQRKALVEMLAQLGVARITARADGHAALACFDHHVARDVNLAIIDLSLPGLDGLSLLRTLAERASPARVIVIGAFSDDVLFSVETLALSFGVELLGALAKPVDEAQLAALIDNYRPSAPVAKAASSHQFSFAEVGEGLRAQQFVPYFQPKIALETGQVTGLEAFARWRHPNYGLVEPEAFMPALEHGNRVDFLDWSMIEQSVACCRQLHAQGNRIGVSINLAPATLAHTAFFEQIGACCERHGVSPAAITFELPEASVLSADAALLERLLRLRMAGFGLAIDDYGAGLSNLQLLARIPFTELKIDRSFVDGACHRRPIGAVLAAFLGLARSLGRMSVAVGVENRQDWDFLQGLGCTYAQGYHIAKPMPADQFEGWLDDWRHFF
jgi:EAL domain-containing protein (putative c-di-GMP-specific phosphodiesterase class I)/ActR/RegA family two-component response regulator